MAETSNTTSDTVPIGVDDFPTAILRLTTGSLDILDAEGDKVIQLDAVEAVALLDGLSKHQSSLRKAADAAELQQRWDQAYSVARGLMAAGVRVWRLEPGSTWDPEYRSIVAVVLDTAQDVRDHAAGADIQTDARGAYTETRAEVAPGVVITATEKTAPREVTDPSVAPGAVA